MVLYHCGLSCFTGGYIGVDVFFVLSGYLITGLLLDEVSKSGSIGIADFYARRARRLLPAAAVVLLVTAAASLVLYAPWTLLPVLKSGFASSLWSGNIYFARAAVDYLARSANQNPYLQMWSLGIEEQFYFVWPSLLWLTIRRRNRIQGLAPWMMLGSLALASFAVCQGLMVRHQPWAFFLIPARAWEFAAGGLALLINPPSTKRVCIVFPVLGILSIAAGATLFSETTAFPGYAVLLPVAGTVQVLAFRNHQQGVTWLLENRWMQLFGRLSYAWYLWHWPLLVLSGYLWVIGVMGRLLVCSAALLLAAATHRWIEKPIRNSPSLIRRKWVSLALACGTASLCALACLSAIHLSEYIQNSASQKIVSAVDKLPEVDLDGCHLKYLDTEPLPCAFGDQGASRTIVLTGDSHAAALFPALERTAIEQHWRLISMTKSSCPFAAVAIYDPTLHRRYEECDRWRNNAILKIKSLHPNVVFISSYSAGYIKSNHLEIKVWEAGLQGVLEQLDSTGIQTYLIHDPPAPIPEITECVYWKARIVSDPTTCSFRRDLNADSIIFAAESQASAGLLHVHSVDLNSVICDHEPCSAYTNGALIYRDEHHLGVDFARTLAPFFQAILPTAGGPEKPMKVP